MLNKIEEGSGVEMVLYIDGKTETFKIAVIEREGWMGKGEYEYGFVNEDWTKYLRSPYSGGRTGFGCNPYEIRKIDEEWGKEYKIITTDLDCIQTLANAEEVKAKLAEEEAIRKDEARVKAINALPKTFEAIPELKGEFEFVRDDVDYNRQMSSRIKGGRVSLQKKDRDENDRSFKPNPSEYVARDGKLLVKKFAKDVEWLFGKEIAFANRPKDLLEKLIAREKEVKNLIAAAK